MEGKLWQILVPCNWNDGRPVRVRHHRVWDQRVRSITGGLTVLPPAKGQWIDDDGRLYLDRMIPVNVIATEAQMEEIAAMSAQHYDQLAIMYFLVSDRAIIHERAPGVIGHGVSQPASM